MHSQKYFEAHTCRQAYRLHAYSPQHAQHAHTHAHTHSFSHSARKESKAAREAAEAAEREKKAKELKKVMESPQVGVGGCGCAGGVVVS